MTPSIGNSVSLSSTLREISPVVETRDREGRADRRAEKFETEAPPVRDKPRPPPETKVELGARAERALQEFVERQETAEVDRVARLPDPIEAGSRQGEGSGVVPDGARKVSEAPAGRRADAGQATEVTLVEEFPPPRPTPADGDLREISTRPQLSGDTLLFLTTARFPVPNLVVDQHRANAAYQQAQATSAQASIARVAFADAADRQVSA